MFAEVSGPQQSALPRGMAHSALGADLLGGQMRSTYVLRHLVAINLHSATEIQQL